MDAQGIRNRAQRFTAAFTPQQIVIIGVMGVVALIGLLGFVRWVSQPSYTVLATGLNGEEANDIVDQLTTDGIAYTLEDGGTTVMVLEGDVEEAKLALDAAGIGASGVVGYEIFDNSSFTTSDFEQRVGYQRAIQGELTRTILAIDGINTATVQISIPTDQIFRDEEEAVEASVLIDTNQLADQSTVDSIVQLVASAVPGLAPDSVTVTDTGGHVLAGPGAAGTDEDRRTEMTRQFELAQAAQAESMLAQAFGPGAVLVRVSADLNFDELETESTTYAPSTEAVPIRTSSAEETLVTEGETSGTGAAGVDGTTATSGGSGGTSDFSSNDDSVESVIDTTVERSRTAPGQVERQTVAVMVDSNSPLQIDADQVEALVAAAVGLDEAHGDTISVESLEFVQPEEGTDTGLTALPGTTSPSPLFGYIRMGVGAIVLILALLFLKKGLASPNEETLDLDELAALTAGRVNPIGALAAGPATRGVPNELRLIDQDPEQVATLLRSWVADRRV